MLRERWSLCRSSLKCESPLKKLLLYVIPRSPQRVFEFADFKMAEKCDNQLPGLPTRPQGRSLVTERNEKRKRIDTGKEIQPGLSPSGYPPADLQPPQPIPTTLSRPFDETSAGRPADSSPIQPETRPDGRQQETPVAHNVIRPKMEAVPQQVSVF